MMKEILGVASEPHARRRWFHDEYFDLFVWQAPTGEVTSFQLCYGLSSSEQALVWERESGFYHDGPRGRAQAAKSAGRNAGKAVDPMLARFDVAAGELPPELRTTLMEYMREYVRSKPDVPSRRQRFRRADWQKLEPQS